MEQETNDEKERNLAQNLSVLEKLRPIDDTFMRAMLRENKPLVEQVLRIIMDKEELTLTHMETQADLKQVTGARSLELDVYGTDQNGAKYNLEIQNASDGAGSHRLRYHSSLVDVENLKAGEDFEELPDTYVIFITEKDVHGGGCGKYIAQTQLLPINTIYHDGRHLLYVNGAYRGEDALGKLMHDFNCTRAEEMNYPLMAERMRYLKETKEGMGKMCKLMDEIREEGRLKGRLEGRLEGKLEGRSEGVSIGKIEVYTIMEALNNDSTKADETIAAELSCEVKDVNEARKLFMKIKNNR